MRVARRGATHLSSHERCTNLAVPKSKCPASMLLLMFMQLKGASSLSEELVSLPSEGRGKEGQ